jgi:hypothetical protein
MQERLAYVSACNRADTVFSVRWIPTVDSLVEFFDRHGSPNERMKAHYLLARTYADLGEAPQALDEFHRAVDCVDTVAQDCDYRLLTRIHAQSANLFYEQLMPNEMLNELEKMIIHAHNANDTISWIIALEWKSVANNLLGDKQNAMTCVMQAFNEYKRYGLTEMAADCLPMLIDLLIKDKNYHQAKQYINLYEGFFSPFQNGKIQQGKEIYYYYKGNYYVGINRLDSAEYFYRELTRSCQNKNDQEAAYKGFYELFKLKGETDSVAKYADLCYQTSEERFRESNAEQLSHMQSLYNYNRSQKLAHEKTEEALRQRYLLIFCWFIFVAIAISSVFVFIRYKRKKRREVLSIMQSYQQKIEQQELAKRDLLQLKKKETETLIAQKEREIAERQEIIEQYHQIVNQETPLDAIFIETAEYERFRYLCTHPRDKVTKKDWNDLQKMVDRCMPTFYIRLNARKHLKESDYHICMLLRLHFAYSEICMLTNTSPQYVYSRRVQLLKTVFEIKGKAEEFDKMLWHIK